MIICHASNNALLLFGKMPLTHPGKQCPKKAKVPRDIAKPNTFNLPQPQEQDFLS
jgi:hypothetical protein